MHDVLPFAYEALGVSVSGKCLLRGGKTAVAAARTSIRVPIRGGKTHTDAAATISWFASEQEMRQRGFFRVVDRMADDRLIPELSYESLSSTYYYHMRAHRLCVGSDFNLHTLPTCARPRLPDFL